MCQDLLVFRCIYYEFNPASTDSIKHWPSILHWIDVLNICLKLEHIMVYVGPANVTLILCLCHVYERRVSILLCILLV